MKTFQRGFIATVSALLAACGGGGDYGGSGGGGGNYFCDSITGGGSTVTVTNCSVGCSWSNTNAAADGDLSTFASATNQLGQSQTIRATAQPGVIYPAGGQAGVFFLPNSAVGGLEVRTYLNSVLQEQSDCQSQALTNCHEIGVAGGNPYAYMALYPHMQFDAVELASTAGSLEVHEICHNADAN